jgi:hypothetical protein
MRMAIRSRVQADEIWTRETKGFDRPKVYGPEKNRSVAEAAYGAARILL